jgi:hypothetical protein
MNTASFRSRLSYHFLITIPFFTIPISLFNGYSPEIATSCSVPVINSRCREIFFLRKLSFLSRISSMRRFSWTSGYRSPPLLPLHVLPCFPSSPLLSPSFPPHKNVPSLLLQPLPLPSMHLPFKSILSSSSLFILYSSFASSPCPSLSFNPPLPYMEGVITCLCFASYFLLSSTSSFFSHSIYLSSSLSILPSCPPPPPVLDLGKTDA